MNREIRQLAVLALLQYRPDGMESGEIFACLRSAYPALDDESAQRRFREDLRDLRGAALVSFVSLRPGQKIRRTPVNKDPALRFSGSEHAALQRARDRVGSGPPANPIPADRGTEKLAKLLRVIRGVEERGSGQVAEIAELTGMTPAKVADLVQRLGEGRGVVEFLLDLDVERRGDRVRPGSEFDLPPASSPDHPLGGRGMDEFGLFAYSRYEVTERLDLIARALAESDQDAPHLQSARQKLSAWRDRLEGIAGGS